MGRPDGDGLESRYIRDERALEALCADLRGAEAIAFDTEFVWDKTYFPRLGLVQVAAGGVAAAVDPIAIGTLAPLWDILTDPATETVVHAGRADLRIVYERTGKVARPVFDTQVAAAVLGLGEQMGFQALVERLLGLTLHKAETYTDWTRRPLSREQIEYALDDVRPLLLLRERLRADLAAKGRLEWFREEIAALEDEALHAPPDPSTLFRSIKGAGKLRSHALALLRELAAWREEEAQRRDCPREWIVKDVTLVEIARRPPGNPGALRAVRGMRSQEVDRSGGAIMDAVRRGAAAVAADLPEPPARRDLDPEKTAAADLLVALVRARAREAEIAPNLLATRAQLEVVASKGDACDAGEAPVLHGWRREIVGLDILRLLRGEIVLGVEAGTGRVEIRRRHA